MSEDTGPSKMDSSVNNYCMDTYYREHGHSSNQQQENSHGHNISWQVKVTLFAIQITNPQTMEQHKDSK